MPTYPRMKLSSHFWLHEAVVSGAAARHGADNSPPVEMLPTLCHTAMQMEAVRDVLGGLPILVSSWYRSPEVNRLVGGAASSQHTRGEAVDFTVAGLATAEAARWLASPRRPVKFDQLILEYPTDSPWIHISFAFDRPQRGEVLHITGRASGYQPGLGSWAS